MYDARVIIPDIFDSIMNIASDNKKGELVAFSHQHIAQYMEENCSIQDIKYALYYMCNNVDLGYQFIEPYDKIYE